MHVAALLRGDLVLDVDPGQARLDQAGSQGVEARDGEAGGWLARALQHLVCLNGWTAGPLARCARPGK